MSNRTLNLSVALINSKELQTEVDSHIFLSMRGSKHGKCVKVGHCARNCQYFRGNVEATICDFCGHDISEHILLGIRVLMEGIQALPKDNDISHDAIELEERKRLFTKPKVISEEIARPKISGQLIARECFICYRRFHFQSLLSDSFLRIFAIF